MSKQTTSIQTKVDSCPRWNSWQAVEEKEGDKKKKKPSSYSLSSGTHCLERRRGSHHLDRAKREREREREARFRERRAKGAQEKV